jgi:hypothetical protein
MELNRLETTLCALTVGVAYEWSENHVLAHGLSGQRNPIAFALDHLLSHPNRINARLVTLLIAKELPRLKVCSEKESWDIANAAISYWYDSKCPDCNGRGVIDFEQHQCQTCNGSGRKPRPSHKATSECVAIIENALEFMEGQLQKRLRNA